MFNNGWFQNGWFDNGYFNGPFGQSYSPTALRTPPSFTATFLAGSTTTWDSGDLGFTPKFVRVRSVFRSGTGVGPAPCFSKGWASGATERVCTAQYLATGLTANVANMAQKILYNDAILAQISAGARVGALDVELLTERVRLVVDDAFPQDTDVEVEVFGGPAFLGAKVGVVNLTAGTGLQVFVDPDFKPDVLGLVGCPGVGVTINTFHPGVDFSEGWATSPTIRQAITGRHADNQPSPGVWTMATTSRFFSGLGVSNGLEIRGVELVSFNEPGYTLQANPNQGDTVFGFIAIKGPQVKLFQVPTRTVLGVFDAVVQLPFDAKRVDFAGNPNSSVAQTQGARPLEFVLGTSTGPADNASVWWSLYDYSPIGVGNPTDPLGQRSSTRAYLNLVRSGVGTATLQGDAKVSAMGATIVLDQTDADPTAGYLLGMAWGDGLPLGATLNLPIPLGLVATGSVTMQGALNRPIPLGLVATGSVTVQGALTLPIPLGRVATATVTVQGALNRTIPFGLVAAGTAIVTVQGDLNLPIQIGLVATGSVTAQGALTLPIPFGLSATGTAAMVTVQGALNRTIPFANTATGSVTVQGALNLSIPLGLVATGSVTVQGALTLPIPLGRVAEGAVTMQGALDLPIPLGLSADGSVTLQGALTLPIPIGLVADGLVSIVVGGVPLSVTVDLAWEFEITTRCDP